MAKDAGLLTLGVLAAAAIAVVFVTSAGLPDVLATHFNARGEPNAFMSRDGYRMFMAFMIVFVPFMIAGLPRLIGRRWPRLLNIPNREHWIAPERLSEALGTVYRLTAWPAAVTIALMVYVHWLVMDAHAADPPRLDSRLLLVGIAAFVAFTIAWTVAFYVRFRRPPPSS